MRLKLRSKKTCPTFFAYEYFSEDDEDANIQYIHRDALLAFESEEIEPTLLVLITLADLVRPQASDTFCKSICSRHNGGRRSGSQTMIVRISNPTRKSKRTDRHPARIAHTCSAQLALCEGTRPPRWEKALQRITPILLLAIYVRRLLRYRQERRYLCEGPHLLAKEQELSQVLPRRGAARIRRNRDPRRTNPHAAWEPLPVSNIRQILQTGENCAAQTDYCR